MYLVPRQKVPVFAHKQNTNRTLSTQETQDTPQIHSQADYSTKNCPLLEGWAEHEKLQHQVAQKKFK